MITALLAIVIVTLPLASLGVFNSLSAWRDERDNAMFLKRTGRLPS